MTCEPCLCTFCPCDSLATLRSAAGGVLSLLRGWKDAFLRLG